MGYTNTTNYLKLPQWVDNDKPSFLVDINNAFAKIDENAQSQGNDGSQAATNIEALQQSDNSQNARLTSLENKQRDLDTDVTQLNEDVNQLDNFTGINIPLVTEEQNLSGAINEIASGTVPSINIDKLIEQIGVKYDGVSAKLMIYSSGQWVDYGEQTINNNLLYDNGSFLNNSTINFHSAVPSNLNWTGIAGNQVFVTAGPTINSSSLTFNRTAENRNRAAYSYIGGVFTQEVDLTNYNSVKIYENINSLKAAVKANKYENPEIIAGFVTDLNSTEKVTPFNRRNITATGQSTRTIPISDLTGNKYLVQFVGVFQFNINESKVEGLNYKSGSISESILSVEFSA